MGLPRPVPRPVAPRSPAAPGPMGSGPLSRRRLLTTGLASGLSALALGGCTHGEGLQRLAEERYPPTGQMVETPQGPVHLQRFGAQLPGPTAVLIHGASGNLRDFTLSFAQSLAAAGVPCVAVDRPGFGYTPRGDNVLGHPSIQAWRLDAAMEALGLEHVLAVGHSYGAAVALAWAVANPSRAVGVVPVSGFVYPMRKADNPYHALAGNAVTGPAVTTTMRVFVRDMNPVDVVDFVFAPQAVREGYPEHIGASLAFREGTMMANGEDITRANEWLTRLSRLYPGLSVPLVAVHGDADWLVEIAVSERLVAAVPDGRLVRLEGIGHMPHHVAEPQVVTAIAALHSRLRGTAG